MLELTNKEWVGFGIYLGMKSSHRREEMARLNIDYDNVVAALTKAGVIRSGKMDKNEGYRLFREKFGPNALGSQTHIILEKLGITFADLRNS